MSAEKERWFIANWCDAKGTPGKSYPTPAPEPLSQLEFPWGFFEVYADDDDVIGQKVAESYPSRLHVICTDPPFMNAFDSADVAAYLAWALTHRDTIVAKFARPEVPA